MFSKSLYKTKQDEIEFETKLAIVKEELTSMIDRVRVRWWAFFRGIEPTPLGVGSIHLPNWDKTHICMSKRANLTRFQCRYDEYTQ